MRTTASPDEHFEENSARLDRPDLLVAQWLTRKLPPRDFVFENVFCTTSRWEVIGETGIGKTLFLLDMAFAAASGIDFLNWKGSGKRRRVMYLDGELPAETIKERITDSARIFGSPDLWIYSRDVLKPDEMPPLNQPEGQAWLWREIETVEPNAIFFDSIMSLLIGPMSDEQTREPVVPLIRQLSTKRISQVWAHHTGHDTTRGFGSKTREWELDSVAMMSKSETFDIDGALRWEFTKARLRTPQTAGLFAPKMIHRDEHGWHATAAPAASRANIGSHMRKWIVDAIDELTDGAKLERGHSNAMVRKARRDEVRDRLVKLGMLETDDKGVISKDRMAFGRAIKELIGEKIIAGDDVHVWRIKRS